MNNLKARLAKERRFRLYGILSIALALTLLSILFISIFSQGYTAFQETKIQLDINFEQSVLDPKKTKDWDVVKKANFNILIKNSINELFPDVSGRSQKRKLKKLISTSGEYQLRNYIKNNIEAIGTTKKMWLLADDDVDMLIKGHINRSLPENERRIDNDELKWIEVLETKKIIKKFFNKTLFTSGDSAESEQSGILGALLGSLFALSITLIISFPIGIATAIYLEEFAPKNNKFIDFIEVNINNLAAVPSIIFGLLGLAIFLNFFELPRSAPLVGGMVLSLMTLPTIIISSRVSMKAVPPSIKEGALGVGASEIQAVFHHVVPVAIPGMLTGTIIGMARALGESAPLLVIGMVAFIVDIPQSVTDPATALPIQIYLWADTPERGFVERTSAAIIVLLIFLILMNSLAVYLRQRFEKDINWWHSKQNMYNTDIMNDNRNIIDSDDLISQTPSKLDNAKTVGDIHVEDPRIIAKNINVYYDNKIAINNVSIDIGKNEVLAMIGPSGCGKSTFLRCFNRMNDTIESCIVEGELYLDNENILDKKTDVVPLRAKVGMVFQKPNPFPKSVYDNVAYGPKIHGMAKNKIELDEIVIKSLEKAGLYEEVKDRLDTPGTSLSGGQQQRLCIARTIAVNPEVILMDEPCSALDPIATARIEELIYELKENFTIIIVTHSMQQAARVSQRTAYFHLGSLIEVGSTDKIFTTPQHKLTESYITGRFG